MSRACNNIEIFRLLLLVSDDEQRNTLRAGFDPANVLEKLPDDNSGILTPSSISSIRNKSIDIG